MVYLDEDTIFAVSSLLGYFSQEPERLRQEYSLNAEAAITNLVNSLHGADMAIKDTVSAAIARKLDDLEITPAASIIALRAAASIDLRSLASVAEVPILFDKYAEGRRVSVVHY